MSQIVEKMPYLAMLKNPWKILASRSKCGWLPKFNHFFLVQSCTSFYYVLKFSRRSGQ